MNASRNLSALRLAADTLTQPFSLFVLTASLLGTLALFSCLVLGAHHLIVAGDFFQHNWSNRIAALTGGVVMLGVAYLLFPSLFAAISGLFLETLADRMERTHFPMMPKPNPVSLSTQLRTTASDLIRSLSLNLLVLPFLFIPVINVLAYLAINTRLLLREYFFMVTLRHLSLPEAEALYEAHRATLRGTGLMIAIIFIIPGVNLIAPIVALALVVHKLENDPQSPLRAKLALAPSNVLPESTKSGG